MHVNKIEKIFIRRCKLSKDFKGVRWMPWRYQREKVRHTAKKMPSPLRKDFTGVPLRYGGVSVSVDFLH